MHHPLPRSRRRLRLQLDDVIREERQLHLRKRRTSGVAQQLLATFTVVGYTESEIAKKLGLELTTVKTRAYRARVAVKEHLRAEMA